MNQSAQIFLASTFLIAGCPDSAHSDDPAVRTWSTNAAAVFEIPTTPLSTNPGEINRTSVGRLFHHYLPGSLNNLIWTNFIAHTNGRDMTIWSTRSHPLDWPAHPPIVTWNVNSLIWGMKGITALSPCWQVESGIGQVPVTALTRRHAYARGHGMGPDGFNTNFAGKKIWFGATNNSVIEATVLRDVVRTYGGGGGRDYTILLLSHDLPAAIEPMRVVAITNLYVKYPDRPPAPRPLFKSEQRGQVSTEVPGLTVNTWKAGDSGSPDMLPLPGELAFVNGRSTSGASPEMQADMDQLCRLAGLDPKKYQLKWVDLAAYPTY